MKAANQLLFIFLFTSCCFPAIAQEGSKMEKIKEQASSLAGAAINDATNTNLNSFFITIPYKEEVSPAPAGAKDRLLWYEGKKVNDSMLITPDASLVLYSEKRNVVVVRPSTAKDPFAKMVKRLEAIEEDKRELVEKASSRMNGFFLYPQIAGALKAYDRQNQSYAAAIKNIISLPTAVPTAALKRSNGGYATHRTSYVFGVPSQIRQAFNEVMARKKAYPSLEFPPPPDENFGGCYNCDGIAQNQLAIDSYKWSNAFKKYEADLIESALSIHKTIEQLELNADPEAVAIMAELETVISFAFARMSNKVDVLIKNYGNDFSRVPTIIRTALAVEREKQLLAPGEKATYQETMNKLLALFDQFDKYLEQQMAARNYDLVLNLAMLIGIERQRQLLGGEERNNLTGILQKFFAFNRFKLEMSSDFAITNSEEGGVHNFSGTSGSLATKKDFYVSLAPFECGSFQIFLTSTPYSPETESMNSELSYIKSPVPMDIYSVELETREGIRKYTEVDDEGNEHVRTESYNGVPLLTHLPIARISFCEGRKDTILFNAFYNKGAGTGGKGYELKTNLNLMFAGVPQAQLDAHMIKVVGDAEAYEKRMKAFEVEPTGFEALDRQQNRYAIVQLYQRHAQYTLKNLMPAGGLLRFDAENGKAEIVNGEANLGGRSFESFKINKGVVKIKITHEPARL